VQLCETILVNFNQSSYAVREDTSTLTLDLLMSQPSSEQFEVVVNLIDITTSL